MTRSSYFDNAATTYPKPEEVYSFADRTFRAMGGSIGRGDGDGAKSATSLAHECKNEIKALLGCEFKDIAFTASATDALNRILLGLSLAGATVYVSPFEHNAVTRTLRHLELTEGIDIRVLPFDNKTLLLNEQEMRKAFESRKPDLVAVTHASNVCGAVLPVEKICAAAKEFDSITLVDMSQTAGIVPLQLSLDTIDFAVFAGHKTLLAPFGIGGFVFSPGENRLNPVIFGGNGVDSLNQDMPNDLILMEEVGSQNTYAIAGLMAGARWLIEHNDAAETERARAAQMLSVLRSHPNIRIIADEMECTRTGVTSCLFAGYSPDEIGSVLRERGISVRTGLHCSPYAHKFLETLPLGTVRFSVSPLTTEADIQHLDEALEYIESYG